MQNDVDRINRRRFIATTSRAALLLLAGGCALGRARPSSASSGEFMFLEAEGFDDHGGWVLDQQSMDQMGSPYLLAHGLGIPVRDAVTKVTFPSAGTYRLWVRTRDWVAPWNAPGAPGKFQVLINGRPVPEIFGTRGADWHWQGGGMVNVPAEAAIGLHDLTGFEGRCDSILFCKDPAFVPSNDVQALDKFRRKLLGLPDHPEDGGEFDLVVAGGGLAGTCAAISAARQGLTVALVQDRPVLGGNGSSEVRVWPEGKTNFDPYPHLGDIVKELLAPIEKKGSLNGSAASNFDDARKLGMVAAEPRITLFANHRAMAVEMNGKSIAAVVAQSTLTARRTRLRGKIFADCTGDATIGYLAGADHEFAVGHNMGTSNLWNVTDTPDARQSLDCDCKDKTALGMACEPGQVPQPFPRCPWAIDLSDKPFPGRKNFHGQWGGKNSLENLGGWFWESGFDQNPITDIERIRDLNFRAMYGAWDALKNVDKLYPNYRLGWAAFIAGKRESRRLMGDVVVSADDFRNATDFPDKAFPCTWHIDLHNPDPNFDKGLPGEEFISRATAGAQFQYQGPYWAPYRCLYSRNLNNLFMAGRNISVTKDGLGPVRVMRTCGMMGEVVGKAAGICVKQDTTPRGVYELHLATLHELMRQPGATRVADSGEKPRCA